MNFINAIERKKLSYQYSIYDENQFWAWLYENDWTNGLAYGNSLLHMKIIRKIWFFPFIKKIFIIESKRHIEKDIAWYNLIPYMKLFIQTFTKDSVIPLFFFDKGAKYDYMLMCINNYRTQFSNDQLDVKDVYELDDIVYLNPNRNSGIDETRNHRMRIVNRISEDRYSVSYDTCRKTWIRSFSVHHEEIIGAIPKK